MNNDNILNLYEHNEEISSKVFDAFNKDEKRVAIVQATGTGKSYVALNLLLKYKDKKALYIVPSNAIIEHLKEIISKNNLSIEKDFPNLEFRTYQSLINLSKEELSKLKVDLLVTDELHHLGAPVWGKRINDIVETHPDMLLFGMTAYTVRDRATSYERDMTNPDTDELFSGKVVSYYDLCDAMIDGVLPKPIYKSAYINLESFAEELEKYLDDPKLSKKDYLECKKLIEDTKRQITKAPGIKEMVRKNIKPNGKYIYFCPPLSEENKNDIDTIMNEVREWFSDYDVEFYKTTSKNQEQGKQNRDAFYNDLDLDGNSTKHKLRIMFAINQYNEGVHAPGVDGVILGRSTSSDIVFFEQIGRALSVKENTKEKYEEYQSLSRNKLLEIAKSQSIEVTSNMTKDEIIEHLLSPVIIDLTNNIEYIEELENNLKDRVKEIQKSSGHNKREIKIRDLNFDIMIENRDLFEVLRYVRDRLRPDTWELNYSLAKAYFEKNGNLEIKQNFKTLNGIDYDENGYKLGKWLTNQRQAYKKEKLSKEKIELLEKIGMRFENVLNIIGWTKMYLLAETYFKNYGNLEIKQNFKTLNGIDYDENGYKLGKWLTNQRQAYKKEKLSKEKIELLEKIGMRFENVLNIIGWTKMYLLAETYFKNYGNLEISKKFKTLNGIDYDDKGYNLIMWIYKQRQAYKRGKLSKEKIELLEKIGMHFDTIDNDEMWTRMYKLAENYFRKHGNLEIPQRFKTMNGIIKDENGYNLGTWINRQRQEYKKGKLSEDRIELLEKIGMRFENVLNIIGWTKMYTLAEIYFEKYGDLEIPYSLKTLNGIDYDDKGYNLGLWISKHRKEYKKGSLSRDRTELLEKIGMRFEIKDNDEVWTQMYKLSEVYFKKYGNLEIPQKFKTLNGINYDEKGHNLGTWIGTQRQAYKKEKLSKEKIELLEKIGMRFENVLNIIGWTKMYLLAETYFKNYGNLEIKQNFKTLNGIDYDENGYKLGKWLTNQRQAYKKGKLSPERKELLNQIGMIWEIRKRKDKKQELCNEYLIPYEEVENISYNELYAKTMYLLDNNINIIIDDKLNPVYNMSNTNMQVNYGVSLEELIEKYKKKEKEK